MENTEITKAENHREAVAIILDYLHGKNSQNGNFTTLPISSAPRTASATAYTAPSFVIEACHFYKNHPLTEPEIAEIETCGKLAYDLALALGQTGQVERIIFVDDYNIIRGKVVSEDPLENSKQTWQVIEDSGFAEKVKFVFLESLMLQAASGVLAGLLLTGCCRQTKSKTILNVPSENEGVVLLREGSGDGIPSCALLDASCYGLKGEYFPGTIHITILPDSYRNQQEETQQVMKASGIKVPIINIFVGVDGSQQVEFNF